jgi:hypothetical protein
MNVYVCFIHGFLFGTLDMTKPINAYQYPHDHMYALMVMLMLMLIPEIIIFQKINNFKCKLT